MRLEKAAILLLSALMGFVACSDSVSEDVLSRVDENGVQYSPTEMNGQVYFLKTMIPESMRVIGSHAFYRCESLERIVIPKSVEEIESYAFGECKALKEVIIEGSPRIDEAAFENCTALENKPKQ